jgi:PAS domain S-box-containing protein
LKIRKRLAILMSLASSLVMAATSAALYAWNRAAAFDSLRERLAVQFRHMDFAASAFFDGIKADLDEFLSDPEISDPADPGFTSFLSADEETFIYRIGPREASIMRKFEAYCLSHASANSVYMGRATGGFVRSHKRDRPTAYDPRERPWYKLASLNPGRAVLTEAYASVTSPDINIGVVKAMLAPDGSVYGVIGIDVTLASLNRFLDGFEFDPAGVLLLSDASGAIIYGPGAGLAGASGSPDHPDLASIMKSAAERDTPIRAGRDFVFARVLGGLGWTAAVMLPAAKIDLQAWRPVGVMAGTLAAGLALLALMTFLGFSAFVIRPLGRFSARIPRDKTPLPPRARLDEISEIEIAYDAMMTALDRTSRELRRHEQQLETLVAQRTASLEEANHRLSAEIEAKNALAAELAEGQALFRDLVQGSRSVIMRWKPDGRITFMNDFGLAFFGYTADELLGHSIVGTILPERGSRGEDLSALPESISADPDGYAQNMNENILRDGRRVWMAWTNKPSGRGPRSEGEMLSIGNDVTRLVETERDLRAALAQLEVEKDRAQAADRLKSSFLATMSHELRTPLNSIIGFTGIVSRGLAGPVNEEQAKQLGMAMDSARHLLALINDVLDISKIEAGQFRVAHEPYDALESIERVARASLPGAQRKGLEMRVESGPGPWTMRGDARRFEQILFNLVGNAVKFTDAGSIRLSLTREAGGIAVSVTDTGIGIKPEDLGALFREFSQVDTGLTRRYEGTGLGLAISRRLARLMGGDIVVESEWGRGTTFTLRLPAGGNGNG